MIAAWGLAVDQLSDGEKNCIVYSLFCIFSIIFVIIITISINISFVALLNCFYLNPRVSPFVHFPSLLWGVEGERAAV